MECWQGLFGDAHALGQGDAETVEECGLGGIGLGDASQADVAVRCSRQDDVVRLNASRVSGQWQDEDYDIFDGDRDVGRIYLVDGYEGNETWFWGVSFQLTGRKSYGNATSLQEAKAASRAEFERWQRERR